MKTVCASLVIFLMAGAAGADLIWFVDHVDSEHLILGPDDPLDPHETSFTTALMGDSSDNSLGSMAQLVFAGADNRIDTPSVSIPTGVSGDDEVVSTRWFGAGLPPSLGLNENGAFRAGDPWGGGLDDDFEDSTVGFSFYLRVWAGVSLDPMEVVNGDRTARIPTLNPGGFLWYGDSSLFVNLGDDPQGDGGLDDLYQIDFGSLDGGFVANQLIPEPSSVVLALVGGLLVARRMRRSGFESGSA